MTQWACNPSFSTIMSHLFCHPCFFVAHLCNILIIITQVEDIFTKLVLIMPQRKKNHVFIVFMQVREEHNVNHEILGASLCDNHNRCPFLLLLWIFGRPPKGVIDYQRYYNASKQLAAWPEVTACLELCRSLLPLHKQNWKEGDQLYLMFHKF